MVSKVKGGGWEEVELTEEGWSRAREVRRGDMEKEREEEERALVDREGEERER